MNQTTVMTTATPTNTGLDIDRRGMEVRTEKDMKSLVKMIIDGGLAPQGMDTPQKVLLSIQHGMELGMTPMQSLQSCMVVNGKVSLYGDGLSAIAIGSGQLKSFEEKYEGEGDQFGAVVRLSRKDIEGTIERRFTIADAKTAGVWVVGGKSPWGKYPNRMLMMRARAWAFRDLFSDYLRGMAVAEEMEDVVVSDARSGRTESSTGIDFSKPLSDEQPDDPQPDIVDAEFTESITTDEPSEFERLKAELDTCTSEQHLAEFSAMEVKKAHLSEAISDDEYDELHRLMNAKREGF